MPTTNPNLLVIIIPDVPAMKVMEENEMGERIENGYRRKGRKEE